MSKKLSDYPELLKEWDYEKNDLLPSELSAQSSIKVWWKKEYNDPNTGKFFTFEWQSQIRNRVNGRGCPYLSNPPKAVYRGFNDLATTNPKLLEEWDYEKNEVLPTEITRNSNKIVWWKKPYDDPNTKKSFIFEWQASVNSRSAGVGCPYLSNPVKAVFVGFNDLATTNPELLEEWHYSKNTITPQEVLFSSPRAVWWKCSRCGNEWETTVRHRTTRHQNCPKCSDELHTSLGEQAIYFYLKKKYPDAINRFKFNDEFEIDIFLPELNIGIEYDGSYYHEKRVKQDKKKQSELEKNGVTIIRIVEEVNSLTELSCVHNIIRYCGRKRGQIDLAIQKLFELLGVSYDDINIDRDYPKIFQAYLKTEKSRSVASSCLLDEWNFEKNGNLRPEFISLGSMKKVWWRCARGHEWQARVGSRNSGNGCPICSCKQVLKGCNDLASTNPELLLEWDYEKNTMLPTEIVAGAGKYVWWKCATCGNEWKAKVVDRKNGKGCRKCATKKQADERMKKKVRELGALADKYPELLAEWDYEKNQDITPEKVVFSSHRKVWWICSKCGREWNVEIRNRTLLGSGCPDCRKKKSA